jgi:LuxR family transcriptional regulator, maltose regulon positive regulatory protein
MAHEPRSGAAGRAPRSAIERPRLLSTLDEGADARLTLVTGPAGSGKTVLLSSWGATRRATTLIRVGSEDWTVAGLWAKLAGALPPSDAATSRPVPRTPEAVVEQLVERAGRQAGRRARTLVLDDFHLADSPDVRATLDLLLQADRAPRLVVGSKVAPWLSLERLRLAGALKEVRGADLQFTLEEAERLLAEDGIALSPEALQSLWTRTEGWAAGLRLAALSLADRPNPDVAAAMFSGEDTAVASYLVEEVLQGQGSEARELLLATAVLDQVSAPLANALAGRGDAAMILDGLADANALVVPLDRRGEWFRYHPLLRDLLRSRLARRGPAHVARQHRRAATWFMERDRPLDALHHAVRAGDWDCVTGILASCWMQLRAAGHGPILDGVLAAVPPSVVEARPEAALVAAARRLDHGDPAAADAFLATAVHLRHRLHGSRRARFAGELSVVRLMRAGRDGDLESGLRSLPAILALGRSGSPRWREVAALAHIEIARVEVAVGAEGCERRLRIAELLAGDGGAMPQLAVEAQGQRAWRHALDGKLRAARVAAGPASTNELQRPASALLASALVAAESGDLRDAAEQLSAARRAAAGGGVQPGRLRRLEIAFVEARVALAADRAEAEAACAALRAELDGWLPGRCLWGLGRTAAVELQVMLGRADEALADLQAQRGPGAVLAVGRIAALLGTDRAGQALIHGRRVIACAALPLPSAVSAWALTAVAAEREGDPGLAQRYGERALELAEAEGLRLSLAAVGDGLDPILRRLLRSGTAHRSLIGEVIELTRLLGPGARPVVEGDEPLTNRELAVLRYLPTLLSTTEIAAELFVSVNTVKSHLKRVYRKLGVSSRRTAVEHARDQGLIAASGLILESHVAAPGVRPTLRTANGEGTAVAGTTRGASPQGAPATAMWGDGTP